MSCDDCKERPRYPHTLIVERPGGTPEDGGHVDLTDDDNWPAVGRIKGRFITKGGREGRVFDQVQAEVTHVIATPSTPRSRTQIDATCRVRWGTRKFNITAAYDVDEAREEVRLEVTEVK